MLKEMRRFWRVWLHAVNRTVGVCVRVVVVWEDVCVLVLALSVGVLVGFG